jgi:hypothetical protein
MKLTYKSGKFYTEDGVEVVNPGDIPTDQYDVIRDGDQITLPEGYDIQIINEISPSGKNEWRSVNVSRWHHADIYNEDKRLMAKVTLPSPQKEQPECSMLSNCRYKEKEQETTPTDKPDFGDWIKSQSGMECMQWPISDPKYLENRLFWAFDAGRDRIWNQYLKQKEELASLRQQLQEKDKEIKILSETMDHFNAELNKAKEERDFWHNQYYDHYRKNRI